MIGKDGHPSLDACSDYILKVEDNQIIGLTASADIIGKMQELFPHVKLVLTRGADNAVPPFLTGMRSWLLWLIKC